MIQTIGRLDGGDFALPTFNRHKHSLEGIVKILALEVEAEGIKPEQYKPHLKAEARSVWELYQNGTIRELYFRADRSEAVLILECRDVSEAKEKLESLPLVQAGLITFELIPLVPYPGFARLFGDQANTIRLPTSHNPSS